MLAALLSLLLMLEIQGSGACPAPVDVQRQLHPLLPSGFDEIVADTARLEERPDGSLDVSLAFSGGVVRAHKTLPAVTSCRERADTVAVTLAIWEARIHPEISLHLDHLAGAEAATSVPVAPAPEPFPVVALRAEPPHEPALEMALGLGLMGLSPPQDAPALGARLDLVAGRAERRWRARVSAVTRGWRTMNVPPGDATWWRSYGIVGADLLMPVGGRWAFAGGVGGVLGVVQVGGSGYPTNHRGWNVDLGAEATARIERRFRQVRPWLGLQAVTWLRRQELEVTGAANGSALPRFDAALALGVDFLWGG